MMLFQSEEVIGSVKSHILALELRQYKNVCFEIAALFPSPTRQFQNFTETNPLLYCLSYRD